MGKLIFIWLILVVALMGCASDGDSVQEVQMGDIFTLGVGQEAVIASADLHLRFDSVLEDSRCPTNVDCFWSGQARIAVSAWQGSEQPAALEFNTNPAPGENVQELTYQGYTIRLDSLDPYPAEPEAIPEDEYRATFTVNPAG